jgi:hypothetical protein
MKHHTGDSLRALVKKSTLSFSRTNWNIASHGQCPLQWWTSMLNLGFPIHAETVLPTITEIRHIGPSTYIGGNSGRICGSSLISDSGVSSGISSQTTGDPEPANFHLYTRLLFSGHDIEFSGTHSLHLPLLRHTFFTPSTHSGLRLSSDGLHNTYLRSSSSPTGNRILTQISLLHSNHVRNLLAGINRWIQEAVARHSSSDIAVSTMINTHASLS